MTTKIRAFDKRLGAAVRERRVRKRLTQADLAQVLGVSHQNVQKKEQGINRFCVEALVIIADALGTTVQAFVNKARKKGKSA